MSDSRAAPKARLAEARVMLVFSPELVRGRDPLEALSAAAPFVDVVQVRPKALGGSGRTEARAALEWCRRVLELAARLSPPPAVLVNDRVDVAMALSGEGLCGVHLGRDDCPPAEARALLGEQAWIGLSTHSASEVAAAADEPVDYLGFGPVHPTATKGAERGLGPERAWLATEAATVPVFAIGGITALNVQALAPVRRVAVGAAILAAADPAAAARGLRELLLAG